MSGFQSPIANNQGQLVRQALQSVNFVAGVSGWQVTRDGDAEFNSAVFRGEVEVGVSPNPRVEVTTTIPATLVAASTDFTWTAGIFTWFNATDYKFDVIGIFNIGPVPIRATGAYKSPGPVNFETFYQNSIVPTMLYGSDTYDTVPMFWFYRHGRLECNTTMEVVVPAVDVFTVSGGTPEQWQSLALGAGWTGFLKYRKIASPPRSVQIAGNMVAGTKADGTVLATLPAGYRPTTTQDLFGNAFGGAISGAQIPHVNIAAATGVMSLFGINTSTNLNVFGIVSLDL